MNANELADELQTVLFACGKERPFLEHAKMLRQLQKEHNGLCNLVFEYQDKTDELREAIHQLQAENEALKNKQIQLVDDLFAERKECLKLESLLEAYREDNKK